MPGRRLFFLPAAWVGDMMEQYDLQGLLSPGADYPSLTRLTHKDQLGDTRAAPEWRTQAQSADVSFSAPP